MSPKNVTPMRIVHVIETLNPRSGGPPAVAVQLSSAQAAAGHEVTLVSYDDTLPESFRWVPSVDQVKLIGLRREGFAQFLTMPEGAKQLAPIIGAADAVHLHGIWEPLLWMSARLAREEGVPYIARPAGMLDPWSLAQKWIKKRVALSLGLRKMLEGAAYIHALNRDERDLVSLLGLRTPVEIVPNGVFLESLKNAPPAGTFRTEHPRLGNDPFVLFMARLHYKKGLDFLADAFQSIAARAPNLKLVVAGPDGGSRAGFVSRISRFKLSDRTIMAGELYGRDKFAALRDATVFCLPSRQEGFSVAVVEALAMGVPSVVTVGCHFPEIAAANAGRVVELNARAIGSALLQVTQDPALRERMSANAETLVRGGYTWPIIAQRTIDLYQKHGRDALNSMKGLRILHVVRNLDPAGGGPPIIALKLATAQAEQGHQVEMLSYSVPEAENDVKVAISQIRGAEHVEQRRLPPCTPVEAFGGFEAARVMRSMAGEVDVVQLHGVWEAVLRAVARECRAAGVPYVVTPHGMLDPWSLSQKKLKKTLAIEFGIRRMLNGAMFLHLGNRDERDLIQPLSLRAEHELVPNGLFAEEVTNVPPRGAFRAAYPQVGDHPFVLFLSRLHYKKGLDYLAEAYKLLAPRHPKIHLVVAGPDGGAREDFHKRISEAGLEDRVHLVGPVYNELKAGAIVDAEVFCLPSRQEGFSIAILEALGCGCPCVVSKACHFPEVEESGAGLVVDLEPPQIADALDTILSNPVMAREMGARGRELVLSRLTWPVIAQGLVDAYVRHGVRSGAAAKDSGA